MNKKLNQKGDTIGFSCYTHLMTITQTLDIPADRRITLEVPREIPTGTTVRFETRVIPFVKKEDFSLFDENGKPRFTRKELDEMVKDCPITRSLSGILKTDMTLDEIRMKRLAKHL